MRQSWTCGLGLVLLLTMGQFASTLDVSAAGRDDASAPVFTTAPSDSANSANSAKSQAATSRGGRKAVRASRYAALISKYAKANGLPVTLAHAVVRIESNYNARARGRAGEIGLMQIKPATARAMGYSGTAQALYDPATNLKWGMKYLAGAHNLAGGDTCGTILRYNGGHYAKRMNPVSARYCRKVQAMLNSGEASAFAAL